jgi:hypothetical protein
MIGVVRMAHALEEASKATRVTSPCSNVSAGEDLLGVSDLAVVGSWRGLLQQRIAIDRVGTTGNNRSCNSFGSVGTESPSQGSNRVGVSDEPIFEDPVLNHDLDDQVGDSPSVDCRAEFACDCSRAIITHLAVDEDKDQVCSPISKQERGPTTFGG